ncbi:uncharacterized protein [Nicotiana tomentosiformis]|uniref:uncharacterized protein n=1 Tax=Nicotiana tomentosiformis TaxID=4098 RepID=UPI00051BB175|nr:uncharacterized protein LOC117279962 [Nicotiana tomentosiformis]
MLSIGIEKIRTSILISTSFNQSPIWKMWPKSNNPPVEPPEVKPMPGRPKRCSRRDNDVPRKKKWGKASKKGAKMTCSNCHQSGHNKKWCKSGPHERPRTTTESTPNIQLATQQSSITTEAMPMRQPSTQHSSVPSSLCQDTTKFRNNTSTRRGRGRGLGIGVGRGKGRGTGIGRGTGLGRGSGASSDSTSTASSAPAGFATAASLHAATKSVSVAVGKKRTRKLGFGIYTDTESGRQVLNPEILSERVISSGRQLKNTSLTNIDLGFKPPGLIWKEKTTITGNQLQQQKDLQMKKKKTY